MMELYHFTIPCNALLIGAGEGLTPGITKAAGALSTLQTLGQPVVWLTKETSNRATAASVEYFQKCAADPDVIGDPAVLRAIKVGEPRYGGPVCCTVNVERTRHVMRWHDFLRTTKLAAIAAEDDSGRQITGRDVLRMYEGSESFGAASWWVSFKPIPASRIWVPMTREQGIEACDFHIVKCTAEAREQWTAQRDSFAAMPPGQRFVLHNNRMALLPNKEAEAA